MIITSKVVIIGLSNYNKIVFMQASGIKKVSILGAGAMGKQVALQCALYDFKVILYDVSKAALESASNDISSYLKGEPADPCRPHLVMHIENSEKVFQNIQFTTNPTIAAEGCDLLIEAVPEIIELKQRLFSEFNDLCPEHTLFASNTSSILPSVLEKSTGRIDKFAALHFHPVVFFCNLVDLMPATATSEKTLNTLQQFCKTIGQVSHLFYTESRRYVFNALVSAWLNQALQLYADGVASPEEIDRDWMIVTQMKYGPFGYFDLVGLDVIHDIIHSSLDLSDAEKQKRAAFFTRYMKKGWLGAKSGRGFYKYPNPCYLEPGFIRPLIQ